MNLQRHTFCILFTFLFSIVITDAKNITFCLYCENADCSGSHPHCLEYELGKCSEFLNLCDEENPHANVSISFTEDEDQTYTYRTYSEEYPTCYKSRILWNVTSECGKCDSVTNAIIECSSSSSSSPFDLVYVLATVIIGVLAILVVLLIVLFFYVKRRRSVRRYSRQYFSEEQTGLLKDFTKQQQQKSSQASQDNNLYMGKYMYSAKFLQEYGVPWAMIEVDHSSTEFEEVSNWFNEDLHRRTPMYFLDRQQQNLPTIGFELVRAYKIINEKKQHEIERTQEKMKKDGVPLEELQLMRAYHGASPNSIELVCRQSLSRTKTTTRSKPQDEEWKYNAPDGVFVVRYPEYTLHESNNGKLLNAGDRVKIVMFYVLLGKTHHIHKSQATLPKGVHALLSPAEIEWCLLDDAQCLPAYVIEVEAK